jgi:hypothetical protein
MQLTPRRVLLALAMAVALLPATGSLTSTAVAAGQTVPDISGEWTWRESSIMTLPDDLAAAFFGVVPEGRVMHLTCEAWGELTVQQNGLVFSGSLTQQASCVTGGGQPTPTTPFPGSFDITGSISGRSVHFTTGDLGPGVVCSYAGSVSVADGVATSFNTTGGCDIPFPFHPSMSRSVSFDATRQ